MILFKKSNDLLKWLNNQKKEGNTIGFVPTMGALHEGHLQLIEACLSVSNLCVCSIFVNPAQFNDPRDYEKYPVTLEKDIEMLVRVGTDVLFLPTVSEIYGQENSPLETYELGGLGSILEGHFRPGHFQGVCQVMSRLLRLVGPDDLYMGQKDYQQCLVIQLLTRLLKLPVNFHTVSTIREADGLAKSSRNLRLTPEQRKNASAISQALEEIRNNFKSGNTAPALEKAWKKLENAHFKTDYISIAHAEDLVPIFDWNGKEKAIALIAAYQGEVRLIDNMQLN